jgi:hypothetical protein
LQPFCHCGAQHVPMDHADPGAPPGGADPTMRGATVELLAGYGEADMARD